MKNLTHALILVFRGAAIAGCCVVVLLGCSKKSDQSAAPAGQVIAHVGSEDVTAQELENEFRLANVPADRQQDPAVIKQVLGELVLRKYLLGQAMAAKLDREPTILLDLLRARTQVLTNAYMARQVSAKPITQAEIDKYIADNPMKFANRQLISVQEVTFPIGPKAQAVVDAGKDLKTLDEVDQMLTSMDVPHGRQMGALNSGELPDNVFNLIQAKKADDIFFIRSGANGVYFKVIGMSPRPLEGEAATNTARQLLRSAALNAEIGTATVAANLEAKYEGNYAKIMETKSEGGKNQ